MCNQTQPPCLYPIFSQPKPKHMRNLVNKTENSWRRTKEINELQEPEIENVNYVGNYPFTYHIFRISSHLHLVLSVYKSNQIINKFLFTANSRTLPHPRHHHNTTNMLNNQTRDDQMLVTKGAYIPSPSPAPPIDGSYYNMNSERYLSYPPLVSCFADLLNNFEWQFLVSILLVLEYWLLFILKPRHTVVWRQYTVYTEVVRNNLPSMFCVVWCDDCGALLGISTWHFTWFFFSELKLFGFSLSLESIAKCLVTFQVWDYNVRGRNRTCPWGSHIASILQSATASVTATIIQFLKIPRKKRAIFGPMSLQ